jgi:hypothetical protein
MKSRIISVTMVAVLAFAGVFRGRRTSQCRALGTSITMGMVEIETVAHR